MRYLGLDLGTTTLGVSISDKSGSIVTPLEVIKFKREDYESVVPKIKKIIDTYKVDKIILGNPLNMDGTSGFASCRTQNFQKLLQENNIECELVDERLSTIEAENIIHENNDNIKNAKYKIDAIAASVILESYLKGLK